MKNEKLILRALWVVIWLTMGMASNNKKVQNVLRDLQEAST
jgi:hypothetical protein